MFLFNIYLLVQASSFLVCILLYKTLKNTHFKYFLPFLFITLSVELIGYWLITKGIRNYTLFNVFTTFEFVFYIEAQVMSLVFPCSSVPNITNRPWCYTELSCQQRTWSSLPSRSPHLIDVLDIRHTQFVSCPSAIEFTFFSLHINAHRIESPKIS